MQKAHNWYQLCLDDAFFKSLRNMERVTGPREVIDLNFHEIPLVSSCLAVAICWLTSAAIPEAA